MPLLINVVNRNSSQYFLVESGGTMLLDRMIGNQIVINDKNNKLCDPGRIQHQGVRLGE